MPLVNRTRRSRSIARRLAAERKFHLLPLYALLRFSDLAREGMENSGSFRFADHIYVDRASGVTPAGVLLDRILLSLPPARSFRNRFRHVKTTLRTFLLARPGPLTILSVPSGIPRDLVETAVELRGGGLRQIDNVRFSILDLDPAAHIEARRLVEEAALETRFTMIEADALTEHPFPAPVDLITSTGFCEFLPDEQVSRFYALCHAALASGGLFVTSSTIRHPASAWLMEELAELHAHYRDEAATTSLLEGAGFENIRLERDPSGYQVLVTASK